MKINIITFGRITEIVGKEPLVIAGIRDTDNLRLYLLKRYPAIEFVNYAIAVNEEVVFMNTIIQDGATVAILPPFSGG